MQATLGVVDTLKHYQPHSGTLSGHRYPTSITRLPVTYVGPRSRRKKRQQLSLGQYTGLKAKRDKATDDCDSHEGGEQGVLIL